MRIILIYKKSLSLLHILKNIIFIHGLESSGHGFKGNLFRTLFPNILTPDFSAYNERISLRVLLSKRMKELELIMEYKPEWIIIGSSFGGLMGTLFTLQNLDKVQLLILLAPFLDPQFLRVKDFKPVDIPVIIYHGKEDAIVSVKKSRRCAELLFANLTYNLVEDDHQLHKTVSKIEWKTLLSQYK